MLFKDVSAGKISFHRNAVKTVSAPHMCHAMRFGRPALWRSAISAVTGVRNAETDSQASACLTESKPAPGMLWNSFASHVAGEASFGCIFKNATRYHEFNTAPVVYTPHNLISHLSNSGDGHCHCMSPIAVLQFGCECEDMHLQCADNYLSRGCAAA